MKILPNNIYQKYGLILIKNERIKIRNLTLEALKYRKLNIKFIYRLISLNEDLKMEKIPSFIALYHNYSITSIDFAKKIMSGMSNLYLQMKVIEGLMSNETKGYSELVKLFPLAYIYAVGRLGKSDELQNIKPFIKKFISEEDDIGLVVWTLGKIQAKQELVSLEKQLRRTWKEYWK